MKENLTPLEILAIGLNLKAALGQARFDITGVTKICQIINEPIYEKTGDWYLLQALHMKDWTEFTPATKVELLEVVARVLKIEPKIVFDNAPTPPRGQIAIAS